MGKVLFGFSESPEETGNKAANLLRLQALGFPVPEFLVLPVSALDQHGRFTDAKYAAILLQEMDAVFGEDDVFAVRSSTNAEDGDMQSFAGQFRTELYVTKGILMEAIQRVAVSVESDHVTAYGSQKKIAMAVVIQRMVNADASGVAFGADPVSGARDTKVISAVWGLGEGLVSGALDADTWYMNRDSLRYHAAGNEQQFVRNNALGYGVVQEPIAEDLRWKAPLQSEQLELIPQWLDQLKQAFGAYQDIEFAVEKGKLYLLQSRPITTLKNLPDTSGEKVVWDNSNIVESYPGLTLPLTFSFITDVYEAVYKEFSGVMGIRKKRVEANREIFANMLGLLHGRVYYNLNNWYKALALLPGYSLNARFMEKMMGVKESMDIEIPRRNKLAEIGDIFYAVRKILGNLRTANRQRLEFMQDFYSVLNEERYRNLEGKGTAQLVRDFQDFETTLTGKWKAPLVNDFFCMIYFGLLQKQVKKYAGGEGEYLHNDLLSGSKDVVSAEPVKLIQELLAVLRKDPVLLQLFLQETPEKIVHTLLQNPSGAAEALFFEYIDRWGDRTVAELKLETITYRMQPTLFVQVLRMHLQGTAPEKREQTDARAAAEQKMETALRGTWWKKIVYRHVLKKARYFVSNRENLRYERTRGFAKVREIFVAIGNNWKAENILDDARDIFYLRKQEIFDFVAGHSPESSLRELVRGRKELYANHSKQELPERIVAYAPLYVGNDFSHAPAELLQEGDMKGIPCSAGVVRAKVRIITDPYAVAALNGDIIVTESTDPGWTALFATSGGILVQRGSLLSHAAIVSREMGIPCIVGISGLLSRLKDADEVIMDGGTGNIQRIENPHTA